MLLDNSVYCRNKQNGKGKPCNYALINNVIIIVRQFYSHNNNGSKRGKRGDYGSIFQHFIHASSHLPQTLSDWSGLKLPNLLVDIIHLISVFVKRIHGDAERIFVAIL